MDESTLAAIENFWSHHCEPEAWNFVTTSLHNGDLYCLLGLLRPFKAMRAGGRPVRVLAVNRAHFAIANLFADRVDEIKLTLDADFTGLQISEWRVVTGRAKFAPGELINMLPNDYFRPPIQFSRLWFVLNDRASFLIHLMKLILTLPMDIAPDLPATTAVAQEEAKSQFLQHGMIEGKTLILFPYQHSHSAGFRYTQECFAALAGRASAMGLRVYTSVSRDEKPIEGTTGVFIPFDLLVPLSDLAGYIVVWRSGISDMLAPTICANVGIYRAQNWYENHSPICYGLGGNERGVVFDLDNHVDPQRFAEVITDTLFGPDPADASSFVPLPVRELLQLRLRPDRPNGLFRRDDFVIRHDWGRIFTSGVLGDGWGGLEPWGIWTHGYRSILYLKPALPASFEDAEVGDRQVFLVLDLMFAIAANTHEHLHYEVEVNSDKYIHSEHWPQNYQVLRIKLRPEQLRMPLRVTFTIDNPMTPRNISNGRSTDDRLIAIGLRRACYELVAPN